VGGLRLHPLLPVPHNPEPTLTVRSIDLHPGGMSCLAAGQVETNEVWDLDFPSWH
jgi:hypothetical protein